MSIEEKRWELDKVRLEMLKIAVRVAMVAYANGNLREARRNYKDAITLYGRLSKRSQTDPRVIDLLKQVHLTHLKEIVKRRFRRRSTIIVARDELMPLLDFARNQGDKTLKERAERITKPGRCGRKFNDEDDDRYPHHLM